MYSYYAGEILADRLDNERIQMEADKEAFEDYHYLKQIPGLNSLITGTDKSYNNFHELYDDYLEGSVSFDFDLIRLIGDIEEYYDVYPVRFDRDKNLFTFKIRISYEEFESNEDESEEDIVESLKSDIEFTLRKHYDLRDVNVKVYCDLYYPEQNRTPVKTNLTDEMQIVLDEFKKSNSIIVAAIKANVDESIIDDWIERGKNNGHSSYGIFYRNFKKITYANEAKRYSKSIANKKAKNDKIKPKTHDSLFNLTADSSIKDIADYYSKKNGFNNWKYDKKNKDKIVFELVSGDGKHVLKMKKVKVKYLMSIIKRNNINDESIKRNNINDETLEISKYVKVSSHRVKVVKSLHGDAKRVDEVLEDTRILPNHISIILNDLKLVGVVEYIKDGKNGSRYRLTDLGFEIAKILKII